MKILVVDDELDLLHAIKGVLEDEGYDVIAMSNSGRALEWLKHELPQLILVDYMMPGMSGPELLAAAAAVPGASSIPAVLMSAVQPPEAGQGARWRVFIKKPFSISTLLGAIAGTRAGAAT